MCPHVRVAPVPVDLARHARTGRRGVAFDPVDQLTRFARGERVAHPRLAAVPPPDAGVSGLTAAARVEDGAVEDHPVAGDVGDHGVAGAEIGVGRVETLRHGGGYYCEPRGTALEIGLDHAPSPRERG